MDKIKQIVENYEKVLGDISSELIEKDEWYKQQLISDAHKELFKLIGQHLKVEHYIDVKDGDVVAHEHMPAFKKTLPKKVIRFRLTM